MADIEALRAKERQAHANCKTCGKEGKGTHRNAGDAGRVGWLWIEAKRELEAAQKGGAT